MATNGTGEVIGRFDIKGAKADVVPLDWVKQPGVEGEIKTTMKLATGGKLTTIDVDGRANGLSAKPSATRQDWKLTLEFGLQSDVHRFWQQLRYVAAKGGDLFGQRRRHE